MRTRMVGAGFVAMIALSGCGKNAPTSGTVPVSGSGSTWTVASDQAETSQDGNDVKVFVKINPSSNPGDYLPNDIVGDLTMKYDGDESGKSTLEDSCRENELRVRKWSGARDETVTIVCRGTVVDDLISIDLHDKKTLS